LAEKSVDLANIFTPFSPITIEKAPLMAYIHPDRLQYLLFACSTPLGSLHVWQSVGELWQRWLFLTKFMSQAKIPRQLKMQKLSEEARNNYPRF
jgi:hypothetical protein